RQLRQQGDLGIRTILSKKVRECATVVANRSECRVVRTDVGGGQLGEVNLAQQLRENGEVRLQRLGQPCTIAATVDFQARADGHPRRSDHVALDARVAPQQVLLEIPLNSSEVGHSQLS